MTATDPSFQNWQDLADTFNALGWFLPAYIPGVHLAGLVDRVNTSPVAARQKIFADGVCGLYPPRAMAAMLLYRYQKCPFVRDFSAMIGECIEASCYGFLRVATTGLAPVIEGIARAIAKDRDMGFTHRPTKLIRCVLKDLGERAIGAASPDADSELKLLVRSYTQFFDGRFWKDTDERPVGETLNRHGLLHGITIGEDFGTRYNFSRLLSVLDLFCLLVTYVSPRSEGLRVTFPSETEESKALAKYFGVAAMGRTAVLDRLPVRFGLGRNAE
ncbi:MAG: hypothetical protein U1E83_05290 [Methylotetracoccus sp.]